MQKVKQASLIDNWDFALFGQSNDRRIPKFHGYVSSIDPTTAGMGVLIGGSQNTFKSILGTVKNRSGLKRRGPADATAAGVISSFEWETSFGATRVLSAVGGNLRVEFDDGTGTLQYIDLLTGLTDAQMNFSFTPWYSDSEAKDQLVFVNGQQEMNMWEGGMGSLASATATTIVLSGADSVQALGFASSGELLINGLVYAYTGAGSNPNQVYSHTSTNATPSLNVGIVSTLHAQLFTTSAAATGIAQVTARVKNLATSSVRAYFKGSIYTDNAGVPGTLVGSTTTSIAPAFSSGDWDLTFNFTDLPASPLTNYHFVLEHSQLNINSTDFDVYIGATGGVGTNFSTNGGTSWTAENGYLYSTVYENTATPNTFVGVSPDPSATPAGTPVVQNVVVSDKTASGNLFAQAFGASFTNDWVRTIGNQVYVGCYNSRLVFESNIENYLNYGPISSLRSPGDANVYTLDSNSRGATSKGGQKGNAVLFGSQGDTYSIVNSVATVQIAASPSVFAQVENQTIDKQTSSDLSSPLSNDFIDSIGDTILFVDGNNQLRQFGTLRNLVTPVYPILSLDVYSELASLDFTGGALRAVAEQSGETVYITCPLSSLTYVYQIREKVDEVGNLTAERLWQPPQVWNISRVALVSGITYGYSTQNPQMYELWDTGQYYDDSPTDDELPYESHAVWAYLSLENRVQQLFFDKVYFEGYMTEGTELFCNVYQEYQGSKGIQLLTVNNPEAPPAVKRARFYGDTSNASSIGALSLGQIPLGQGLAGAGSAGLPKFRTVRGAKADGIFEYALDVFSNAVDAQWEMLVLGTNMQGTPGRSSQLQKTTL